MATNIDLKSTYTKAEYVKMMQDVQKKYEKQISQLQKSVASLENQTQLYENDTKSIREFLCDELNVPYTEGTSLEELQVRFKGQQRKREEEIQGLIAEHNRNWSETFQKLKISLKVNQNNINKCIEEFKQIDDAKTDASVDIPDIDNLYNDINTSIKTYNNSYICLQQTTILQLQSDLNSKESQLKESQEKVTSLERILTNLEIVQKTDPTQVLDNNLYRSFHVDYFKICEMLKEKCIHINNLEKDLKSLKENLSDIVLSKRQQKEIILNLQNQISIFNKQVFNKLNTTTTSKNTTPITTPDAYSESEETEIDIDSIPAVLPLTVPESSAVQESSAEESKVALSYDDLLQENKRLRAEVREITEDHIQLKNQLLHLSHEVTALTSTNSTLSTSMEKIQIDNEDLNTELDEYITALQNYQASILSIKPMLKLPDARLMEDPQSYIIVDEEMKQYLNKALTVANDINSFLFNKMQYYKSKFNSILMNTPSNASASTVNMSSSYNNMYQNDIDENNNHIYNLEYMKDILLKFLTFAPGSQARLRLIPVMRLLYNMNNQETLILNNGETIPKQYDISMNNIDPDTAVDYNELQSIFRDKSK